MERKNNWNIKWPQFILTGKLYVTKIINCTNNSSYFSKCVSLHLITKYRKDDFKSLWKEKWKAQHFLVGNYNIQMTNPSVTVAYSIYVQEPSKVTINLLGPWILPCVCKRTATQTGCQEKMMIFFLKITCCWQVLKML